MNSSSTPQAKGLLGASAVGSTWRERTACAGTPAAPACAVPNAGMSLTKTSASRRTTLRMAPSLSIATNTLLWASPTNCPTKCARAAGWVSCTPLSECTSSSGTLPWVRRKSAVTTCALVSPKGKRSKRKRSPGASANACRRSLPTPCAVGSAKTVCATAQTCSAAPSNNATQERRKNDKRIDKTSSKKT